MEQSAAPEPMTRYPDIRDAIADALLAGPADPFAFANRIAWCFGGQQRWIPGLARRAFRHFGSGLLHRDRPKLVAWLDGDRGLEAAWREHRVPPLRHVFLDSPPMAPRPGPLAACDLPALPTPGDLARWLGVTPGELDWFADVTGRNPASGPLAHYRHAWIEKRRGKRLLEAPKDRLRAIQRKVLREMLEHVPLHHAAHGFRRGRSCATFVRPHVGRALVLRLDLREFFASIPGSRVHALFEMLGYPAAVARLLTGLCTHAVPMAIAREGVDSWLAAKRLGVPHLPQGAPTSPALANLCALHLDLRLDALAKAVGANYTRYADDLALSGDAAFARRSAAIARSVGVIALEEGFQLHHRKTRAMPRSHRQQLTGLVINERPNVRRTEVDRLKAILTNCVRHGPATQNREEVKDFRAHLAGRVAHVRSVNAARGEKLDALFARIDWSR